MGLDYVLWSVVAMVSYSFVFLFAKLAMRDGTLSGFTVMTIAVVVVTVGAVAVTVLSGAWNVDSYTARPTLFAYAAGVALTLAVVGYFRALATGPASIVVPIYGMFIVGGSILGIVVLDEPVTTKKVAGIGLAAVSITLIAS